MDKVFDFIRIIKRILDGINSIRLISLRVSFCTGRVEFYAKLFTIYEIFGIVYKVF